MSEPEAVWIPTARQAAESRLGRFALACGCSTYAELCRKASADPRWFWDAMVRDLGISFSTPYREVMDTSSGPAFTRWFTDGRLNAYDSCVVKHARSSPSALALLAEDEAGRTRQLTYGELEDAIERAAAGMSSLGVTRGTAVGLFLPLVIENAVALLACAKLGAIAVPLFSGFGADAIRQRLEDAGATLLVTADGALRRGRPVAMKGTADQALEGLPGISSVLVVACAGLEVPMREGRDLHWDQLQSPDRARVETEAMSPQDPFLLLYTSGTTGRPKGTVHGHAGLPIKSAQDWAYGMDFHQGERFMWVTDMGWVMGPLLVLGSLMLGGTAVLYDGAADYPDARRLWTVAERHAVTHLGISPTLIRVLMSGDDASRPVAPPSRLRLFASTGEPWTPEAWTWLFNAIGHGRFPIINYSGGTECGGGLLSGNLMTPCRPGSFAGPLPGVDAAVYDTTGRPVVGEVGELVVRQPYLGMTLGFWKDPERYLETYWSRWPGVWVHGDWALTGNDGLWFILGRSDDTIKVAGKRLGPAEVEAAALDGDSVAEAAAVGVPDAVKGQSVVVFVVARPGADPGSIPNAVSHRIENSLGKPFRPRSVHLIPRLPKTRNGKILRRVIRSLYLGEPPGDLSSLDDPAAIGPIQELAAAQAASQRPARPAD